MTVILVIILWPALIHFHSLLLLIVKPNILSMSLGIYLFLKTSNHFLCSTSVLYLMHIQFLLLKKAFIPTFILSNKGVLLCYAALMHCKSVKKCTRSSKTLVLPYKVFVTSSNTDNHGPSGQSNVYRIQ